MKKYYMVRSDNSSYTVTKDTLGEARSEAARLFKLNPKTTFSILEMVDYFGPDMPPTIDQLMTDDLNVMLADLRHMEGEKYEAARLHLNRTKDWLTDKITMDNFTNTDPSLDELIIGGIKASLNDLDGAEGVQYEEAISYLESAIYAIEKAHAKETQQAFDDSADDGCEDEDDGSIDQLNAEIEHLNNRTNKQLAACIVEHVDFAVRDLMQMLNED